MNTDLSIIPHRTAGLILVIGLVVLLFAHILLLLPLTATGGMVVIFGVLVLFLHRPLWGFVALLIMRTSVDFLDSSFSISLSDTISLNVAAILGITMIVMSAVLIITNFTHLSHRPLAISFGLFIIFSGASIIYSIDRSATFQETLRLISIFAAFFGGYILCEKIPYARATIISAILISSILPLTFAVFQLATDTGFSDNTGTDGRLFGTFKHPNSFASFLLIIIALLTHRTFTHYTERQSRHTTTALLVFTITVLILTFSRGGWFAFMLFFAFFSLLRAPKILFFTALIACGLFFTSQTVHDRIEDIYNPPADSSIRWRIQQWKNAIDAWRLSPTFGYGSGTEIAIFEREQGFYAGNPYTHNDMIKVLQETGIVGLGFFVFLLFTTFFHLIRAYRHTSSSDDQLFILVIILLFIAQIGFGLSSNIWRGTAVQWLLWVLIACALSSHITHKKRHLL